MFSILATPLELQSETTIKNFTCMATGKSFWASGGNSTSTAFLVNGWFPAGGVPTSITCSCQQDQSNCGIIELEGY